MILVKWKQVAGTSREDKQIAWTLRYKHPVIQSNFTDITDVDGWEDPKCREADVFIIIIFVKVGELSLRISND